MVNKFKCMHPSIKKLLGESEPETHKIPQTAVMYIGPDQVASDEGCHCGRCMFFHKPKAECFLTSPPACDAAKGVCGIYLGGKTFLTNPTPLERIPKKTAGYITDAPTHCANCEYFIREGRDGCQKVDGVIHAKGCCSGWEGKKQE